MKKSLLLAFGLCSMLGYSQKTGNNELKINLPYFIIGMPEVTYERILSESSAVGISGLVTLESPDNIQLRWMVSPYYRMYFGKGKAKGFFIEGSAVAANQLISYDDYINNVSYDKYSTNFGYGAAIGVKLLNKNGFMGELFGGVSRVFGVDTDTYDATEFYPRFSISIGKRF